MVGIAKKKWESLERWRSTAFLVGGVIFLVDTAVVAARLVQGTDPQALGQAFVGAAWTAAFIGLLGMYPSLADRSRWLTRIGAVFSVIGAVVMAAMAVTSFAYFAGVLGGALGDVVMYFLPGVFLGIVLGFGSFGVATLRTDVYPRSVGVLFLLLPLTFLFNLGTGISGYNPTAKVLGVVVVLTLTMLAIGYLLRTGGAVADREDVEPSSEPTAG